MSNDGGSTMTYERFWQLMVGEELIFNADLPFSKDSWAVDQHKLDE